MISRSSVVPSLSSSRQMINAWKVSGLSQRPPIIVSRPASMRLAIAISPSRDRSSTDPISRRYMRTGSSVRSVGSFFLTVATAVPPEVASSPPSLSLSSLSELSSSSRLEPSSASSSSTTLMPMSDSIAIVSSICSEVTSSEGRTEFSSSMVT
ncbi:hypothetical protein D3C73_769030 [compost metagenome]